MLQQTPGFGGSNACVSEVCQVWIAGVRITVRIVVLLLEVLVGPELAEESEKHVE